MDGPCPTRLRKPFGSWRFGGGGEGNGRGAALRATGWVGGRTLSGRGGAGGGAGRRRGGGEAALKARKHPGRAPTLTARQKLQVRGWINGKDPRQYGFDFGLWTRQIVAALIEQKFEVRIGVTAVGRLLAELDITPQKP